MIGRSRAVDPWGFEGGVAMTRLVRVGFWCPRSGGRVRANRVRTVQVAALSDVMCRSGAPGALLLSR